MSTIGHGTIARRSALALATALLALPLAYPAPAQEVTWPRQITIVVPFPPGASNDTFARVLAQKLAPKLGTTIVVDNKPGAGSTIGAAFVARAKPDGATLMLSSSTFTGSAAIMPDLPYDAVAGFTPIVQLAKGPMILAVHPDSPIKSIADLIAAAGRDKGKLNFGSAGVGSINHMSTELMNGMAGLQMTHVPYKGIGPAITDLMGGRIELVIASFPSIAGQMSAGKVRGLGVTSAARSPFAPDLPPIADAVPGYAIELWWGIFGPAGLPATMTDALNREIRGLLSEEDMRTRFAKEGAVPAQTSPAEFAAIVKADLAKLRTIAAERGIKAE